MKFNLKNKPQLYKIPSDLTEHLKFETQIIEWFEGFEKELREQLVANNIASEPIPMNIKDWYAHGCFHGSSHVIKEILGEASTAEEGSRGG